MGDPRFGRVYDRVGRLFINLGYSRTQMRHIVRETNISTGALYTLFTGKKAILDFILKCVIEPAHMHGPFSLPVGEEQYPAIEQEVIAAFEENNARFSARLQDGAASYTYRGMLEDAFDVIARYGMGVLILEKNPNQIGVLGDYYKEYRRKFFGNVAAYVELFAARGELCELRYGGQDVRLMIETLSWWGMHVHYNAFEVDTPVPMEVAKGVSVDALCRAYGQRG